MQMKKRMKDEKADIREQLINEPVQTLIDDTDKSEHEILYEIHLMTQKVALLLEKSKIREYTDLVQNPKRLMWVNFLGGVAKGVGLAIGLTVITGTLLYFLQMLGALNLPIIGDYIAEIVRIVQRQLDTKVY